MNAVAIFAATAALNWTMPDGKVVTETQELVPFDNGVKLELSRDKILSMKAKRLDVIPDFARANKVLEQAIMAPEIRIRNAWKPVPSPVLHQAPENEPKVAALY